jgi:hypothetical protein
MSAQTSAVVGRLISETYSIDEARRFALFRPDDDQLAQIAHIGSTVMQDCYPPIPAPCAIMSALYAERLAKLGLGPVHVVAGALDVLGVRIFGTSDPTRAAMLSASNFSWDGHAWIMLGPYVADVSLFRTARSDRSHPVLREHVTREFGSKSGLLIVRESDAQLSGLEYFPEHVLSNEQREALANGARSIFGLSK